jgi:tetratricopeptide (TPR) repeat protein
MVALERNDLSEAARQLTAALQYSRNTYPMAALNRGICFMRLGNYERAIRDFDAVLTLDGNNARARQLRQQAQQLLAQRQ